MLKILERKITLQVLVLYGLFGIPLLLGGVELDFFQYDALQQSAQQVDLGLAQSIAQNIETQVQGAAEEAMSLAYNPHAVQFNRAQLLSLFSVSRQTHPEISQYIVCDLSNTIVLTYPPIPTSTEQCFSANDYFQSTSDQRDFFVSAGRISQSTGPYVVSVATHIMNGQHQSAGVMI